MASRSRRWASCPPAPKRTGLYPSRDARFLYVSNPGVGCEPTWGRFRSWTSRLAGWWPPGPSRPRAAPTWGGVSPRRQGPVAFGPSPPGGVRQSTPPPAPSSPAIKVGAGPHGLSVWPQPGPILTRPHRHSALVPRTGDVGEVQGESGALLAGLNPPNVAGRGTRSGVRVTATAADWTTFAQDRCRIWRALLTEGRTSPAGDQCRRLRARWP